MLRSAFILKFVAVWSQASAWTACAFAPALDMRLIGSQSPFRGGDEDDKPQHAGNLSQLN
jgi:hypothetical protein